MRSRWNPLIVLIYMAISGSILAFMAVNMGGPCLLAKCTNVSIEFRDAAGLLHSNDLRMAGIKVGQVTTIVAKKNYAVASVQIEDRFMPVYKDAHAVVRPKNLLGETYVEIDKGTESAGTLGNGDTIHLVNTITPVQVDEVLNALDPTTRQKLGIVINALGEATAARGQDLNLSTQDFRRITAALATTSTSLNEQKDNIDALIVQLDLLQQTAADYHAQLAQVLRDWNDTSKTMQAHSDNFASAIDHLGNVLANLDAGLTPNTPALTKAVAELPATADHATDFLGISSSMAELFLKPVNGGTNGQGAAIDDAINLFPRLSQVMIGVNSCDFHKYANGYVNVPGQTEPASCASQSAQGEVFTGQVMGNPALYNQVSKDRHLWRVMGMVDTNGGSAGSGSLTCGLFTNPGNNPSSTCYPGSIGTDPYKPAASSSGTTGSAGSSNSGGTHPASFWNNLWTMFTGADNA
ncbi:MAG: phospholipid/cholesterol/gamma-HCH transport system substrate-binding protein [Chloroflexota bacterium]|nr:phospholipid/cholesterol/gamma-HCH transport system substrate-binding protein [Chloroflexota bacterium]